MHLWTERLLQRFGRVTQCAAQRREEKHPQEIQTQRRTRITFDRQFITRNAPLGLVTCKVLLGLMDKLPVFATQYPASVEMMLFKEGG
jgi:hypothetical protein